MTPRIVIDSCVAVKWIVRERESEIEDALGLLDRHLRGEVIISSPAHMRLEFLNALWSRHVRPDAMVRASDMLTRLELDWRPIDPRLAEVAAVLADTHRLTVYDAVFAALANELDCELITADRALAASGACRTRLLGETEGAGEGDSPTGPG